jgi:DNA-binding XRE family transcriptional regulator
MGGAILGATAIANAVEDAVAHLGVTVREVPVTPAYLHDGKTKERRAMGTKAGKKKRDDLDVWLDAQSRHDPGLRERVEARVAEMALEDDLVALRESAGVSQRALAQRLGVSQPAIAKLESGKAKNIGILTARSAAALGGQMRVVIIKPSGRSPRMSVLRGRARATAR